MRCRQCQATIEVDASDVDPESLPEIAAAEPTAASPVKPKSARPAPPPRPTAKSTLMGIGAPRPAGSTELLALSPGFLEVKATAEPVASPHGFPEPPPPPLETVEVLDAGDWEEAPPSQPEEAAPESLDDFAEELPPSVPPEEEMPSSAGTPSLKALTHHDGPSHKPHVDDFLANMTAAMNGGIASGAPTIDVSGLTAASAGASEPPSIDVSNLGAPARGAKTLPLFTGDDEKAEAARPSPAVTPAPSPAEGSLSPAALDRPASQPAGSSGPRERKNVVAPASKGAPPASSQKPSGTAAPLLLLLAAAAGFLIWKRSAAHAPPEGAVEAERPAEQAPAPPVAPVAVTPAPTAEPTAPPSAAAPGADEVPLVSTPNKAPATAVVPAATPAAGKPAAAATEPKPEPPPEVAKEESTPEPAAEPTPPAEPAGPFDKAAAAAALNTGASQASVCRKEGDPSGVASVVVTFAPSGRVTSANISGPPFAGTPTGGCIASALRKTRIPAFDGERVTVSKTVVIQ